MVDRQWLNNLIPPLLAGAVLAGVGFIASAPSPVEAVRRPAVTWTAPAAAPPAPPSRGPVALGEASACTEPLAATLGRPSPMIDDPGGGAWYRLDPDIDQAGLLTGQILTVGAGKRETTLVLDPEAAASGPVGDAVLVVSDDGVTSQLAVVDARVGCVRSIARTTDLIRRAVLDPSGTSIVEHRLERSSRTSGGIWRRPLGGQAEVRLLAPIAADDRFGRTFSTELEWTDDGRLVVQTCGAAACRTRVVDIDRGIVDLAINDARQGELIGVSGTRLVTYEACRALPCSVVATDLRDDTRRVLARAAGFARLVAGPAGTRLVHEVGGPGSGSLRTVRLDGASEALVELGPGVVLVPSASRSGSASALPPGWLLLSGDGRSHGPGGRTALEPFSGQTRQLDEVIR